MRSDLHHGNPEIAETTEHTEIPGGGRLRPRLVRQPGVSFLFCVLAVLPLGDQPGRCDDVVSVGVNVIERIVAVVDGRPLMLTEVELVAGVRGLARDVALEALIDQRLMFREASRLPQTSVSPEDEERALQSLRARFPAQTAQVSETDLRRLARRELAILKYVEFRFRPLVRVADEELRKVYPEKYPAGDAPPFESVVTALREELERKELDRRIEAWVAELRSGAEIRYNR